MNEQPKKRPLLDIFFAGAKAVAAQAAGRAAEGAAAGVKREFSPDAALVAVKTLRGCLAASDADGRKIILEAMDELAEEYDP